MIIIAAPSCCGKSTFADLLMRNEIPQISEEIGVLDDGGWEYCDLFLHEQKLSSMSALDLERTILHYTLPYPALKFIFRPGYDKASRLRILTSSESIKLVTLFAMPTTLLDRTRKRRVRVKYRRRINEIGVFKYMKILRTLNRLDRIYLDKYKLLSLYENWFEYSTSIKPISHHLVNVDNHPFILAKENHIEILGGSFGVDKTV